MAAEPYLHGRHADVRRLPREQLPGDDAEAEHLRVGAAQKRHRLVQQDSVQGMTLLPSSAPTLPSAPASAAAMAPQKAAQSDSDAGSGNATQESTSSNCDGRRTV